MNRMPFQRASEEKLRTRRIVSVAGRFRRSAAEKPPPCKGTIYVNVEPEDTACGYPARHNNVTPQLFLS